MIYEKAHFSFGVHRLIEHLYQFVLPLPPGGDSPNFFGWSVYSSNGSYLDGWHKGHLGLPDHGTPESFDKWRQKGGFRKLADYIQPTEICHGYLAEVLSTIANLGLEPKRVRIICLPAGASSIWHSDAPGNVTAVRLHVPLVTNAGCFFETQEGRAHLAADGSAFFLLVNRLHRVVNEGATHRYHLVMDVRDLFGVTEFHRWSPPQIAADEESNGKI